MSRIHEALKKAEQERAGTQAVPLETSPVGEMPGMAAPAATTGVMSGAAAAPQLST